MCLSHIDWLLPAQVEREPTTEPATFSPRAEGPTAVPTLPGPSSSFISVHTHTILGNRSPEFFILQKQTLFKTYKCIHKFNCMYQRFKLKMA